MSTLERENQLQKEYLTAKQKSAKPMLWVSMVSMFMLFLGITSGYIVSEAREDWVLFDLPKIFIYSTIFIILSSITFYLAKKQLQKNNLQKVTYLLWATFFLGVAFVVSQFTGFKELINNGLFFTGKESNPHASFLYIIIGVHLLHIFAGLIVLLTVIYNHYKKRYNSSKTLGLELGEIYWHFVDAVWIYLFLFIYFKG